MTILFDKKLAELDAYLQMLIEQTEILNRKLDLASNEEEKNGILLIKNNLESLLGSIKHAIVLLQIAKVSVKTTPPLSARSVHSSLSDSTNSTSDSKPLASSASTPAPLKSPQEQQRRLDHHQCDNQASPQPPARSYKRQIQQQSRLSQQQQTHQHPSTPTSSSSAAPSSEALHTTLSQPQSLPSIQTPSKFTNDGESKLAQTADYLPKLAREATTPNRGPCNNRSISSIGGSTKNESDIDPSGEDEDDDDAFYDAADETQSYNLHNKSVTSNFQHSPYSTTDLKESNFISETAVENIMSNNNNNININNNGPTDDGSIDWDELYDEEEEDLGSLENQGSVIKHLLSQIRIGMDLTKVVLPTFILERRSLLEMYADFFAHPDLFSSIPDYDTPEERMIQLVRWYLSAFHAGRKSSVAKKPYNPILGEIFLCNWNMNPQNSLFFVAEQVSHHPPVSAFYAENRDKLISCCSYIYTKSKYLGLSVGVHNIGQGVINLLKHGETYVCTFPSAYGRSILTIPWVELGGSVNISCVQTGYSASIEFVTKPFYGGKKHRVMGEILKPNKEPLLTIDGEWNGVMFSKSTKSSSEKQVFVDTTCLPVIKKQVQSISLQESFESRNVWKEVTRALKLRDVTSATAAKSFIEQKQRDLLKDRMEKGIKWKTRYFVTAGDGWTYSKPLTQ